MKSSKEQVGYDIRIEGLTEADAKALKEKVKCALVVTLPERFKLDDVSVNIKVGHLRPK